MVTVCTSDGVVYCQCVVVHERTVYEGLFNLSRTFLFVVVGLLLVPYFRLTFSSPEHIHLNGASSRTLSLAATDRLH